MHIAIMQPYIFPYIGYFQLIHASDIFVIYNDVNWINRGWINRNRILLNGAAHTFTIACKNTSQNKLIKDIGILPDQKNGGKLLKTLYNAYKKAPFFVQVYPIVENVINSADKLKTIDKLAAFSVQECLRYLGIQRKIVFSDEQYRDTNNLEKADRLIAICKQEQCTHYVNAAGGKELYQKSYFTDNGIKLSFIETKPYSYEQFAKEFAPGLSIIDILMFNSREQAQELISNYELT